MAKVFVLSAPSGAGKSTLIRKALKAFPQMVFSISITTRPPRGFEKDGREYFFRNKTEFEEMIKNKELAEYQEVHGNYYGTPVKFVQESLANGVSVIIDMDVYGKTKFDKRFPDSVGLFINTPSMDDLEKRLNKRGTDNSEVIKKRLLNAVEEIEYAKKKGAYQYTIINDNLDRALSELNEIIKNESR